MLSGDTVCHSDWSSVLIHSEAISSSKLWSTSDRMLNGIPPMLSGDTVCHSDWSSVLTHIHNEAISQLLSSISGKLWILSGMDIPYVEWHSPLNVECWVANPSMGTRFATWIDPNSSFTSTVNPSLKSKALFQPFSMLSFEWYTPLLNGDKVCQSGLLHRIGS